MKTILFAAISFFTISSTAVPRDHLIRHAEVLAVRGDLGFVIAGSGHSSVESVARSHAQDGLRSLRESEKELQSKYVELERLMRAYRSPDVESSKLLSQRLQEQMQWNIRKILSLESAVKLIQEASGRVVRKAGQKGLRGEFPKDVSLFERILNYKMDVRRPAQTQQLVELSVKTMEASSQAKVGTRAFQNLLSAPATPTSLTVRSIEHSIHQFHSAGFAQHQQSKNPLGLPPGGRE